MRRPHHLADGIAFVAVAIWIWLAMMLVHELGHVIAAHATGGVITSVELRPGYLSHTLVNPNPQPATVIWDGFLVGWLAPQLTAPAWRIDAGLIGTTLRAWAAFCLLAGGCYLAVGGGERLTDTGQLIANGWPHWLLIVIGGGVATLGYARSRTAWIAIARRLESKPINWRIATAWWSWLTTWIVGQSLTHYALET
ncbi:hypothetical protein Pla108_20780 [Botrimarina colliarenosi]|uniref:Peptidase family M50 n=1 Tax=Botrimarina colliarenosi TaxID=2528001 RepID=A0A5C6AD83_9BACT|nr:hypothetical protein [Botrimarina colliarenosi]TWT97924.1 hypothetical protein Pla108_20780 [Botrimarina colliarenosi]